MGLVTDVNDDAAPTVLIVDNNPMASMRLTNLFKAKNFNIEVCEDGDKAVDEYIRLDPELVVLSLDLPSLDGHLAALEMREHGGEQRIVFVAPSRMAELARNASFSAGAVTWLQKPISSGTLESSWSKIIGTIPEAPGLEDLDALYPEDRVKVEADEGALMPVLPELTLPLPEAVLPDLILPEILIAESAPSKIKKSWLKRSVLIIIILGIVGYAAMTLL